MGVETSVTRIPAEAEIGLGWRLIRLVAKNSATAGLLKKLGDSMWTWDRLAKPVIARALTRGDVVARLPASNAVNPALPPLGSNFRLRKWYDPDSQSLFFWVLFEART